MVLTAILNFNCSDYSNTGVEEQKATRGCLNRLNKSPFYKNPGKPHKCLLHMYLYLQATPQILISVNKVTLIKYILQDPSDDVSDKVVMLKYNPDRLDDVPTFGIVPGQPFYLSFRLSAENIDE